MATQNGKNTLLTALICVLIFVVAVLAYMVYLTNRQMETLLGNNQRPTISARSNEEDAARTESSVPDPGRQDPRKLFSRPFDPNNWDPFSEMNEMHRRIDAMFNDAFGRFGRAPRFDDMLQGSAFTPRMDLVDKGDNYVVRLDIPGAENSEIDVSLEDQTLTVEAASKFDAYQKEKDRVIQRERRMGRFRRQITLPEPVDPASLKTNYDNGVLTITIRKKL